MCATKFHTHVKQPALHSILHILANNRIIDVKQSMTFLSFLHEPPLIDETILG
jgi:hypothetical protein